MLTALTLDDNRTLIQVKQCPFIFFSENRKIQLENLETRSIVVYEININQQSIRRGIFTSRFHEGGSACP
jgi:hypothetical protein